MISSLIQKTQKFVNGSLLKVFIIALLFSSPFSVISVPVLGPSVAAAESPLDPKSAGEARSQFATLAGAMQGLAAVLLVIGCIIAGVMFITGKTDLALKILAGAIIVFGGVYIIKLVMTGLGVN